MLAFAFLVAAAFTFADPAGDAHGDGRYVLPKRPAANADSLDLREFSAEAQDGQMRFTVGYGAVGNPWNLKSGFSAGVTDIFVRSGLGGIEALDSLNLNAAGAGGWQYHLRVMGSGASLQQFAEGGTTPMPMPAPQVSLEGTNLVIRSAIPAGEYGYWVTSSVYSPLSADGVVRPTAQASDTGVQAPTPNAPVPVDVLADPDDTSAYSSGSLSAVGRTRDDRPWWLLFAGLLGLLTTGLATWRIWQEQ